jgi:hypothetical protein
MCQVREIHWLAGDRKYPLLDPSNVQQVSNQLLQALETLLQHESVLHFPRAPLACGAPVENLHSAKQRREIISKVVRQNCHQLLRRHQDAAQRCLYRFPMCHTHR